MSDFRYGGSGGFRGPPSARPSYYGPQTDATAPAAAGGQFPPRGPPVNAFPPHARMGPPPITFSAQIAMRPPMAFARPPPQAAQLPAGWTEHFTPQGVRYYYNASTGVSTYDLPTAMASATAAAPQNGAVAAPGSVTWIEYKDDASGQSYYYNTVTKATTWDQPEEFRMQQARAEVEKMKSTTEADGMVEAEEQRRKEQKRRQADEEAMKMYQSMPKDERVAAFKAFLEEKQVSPQSKWQEAQRFITKEGIDKDPRWKFALSTVGEKKQAFSEYCTQAVNKQNIERRRHAKRIREEFLELLNNVEEKVLRNRVTWEDVSDGAEFYGLRKDPRWNAIEEAKEKKDLFEGFVQDVLRKKSQQEAKLAEAFKDKFMAKLREKCQDDTERPVFSGKRRLDSDIKKKVWEYFDEVEGAAELRSIIPKHDVYDWTELYLDELKAREAEIWKAEREKKKQLEAAFTTKLHDLIDQWVVSEKVGMNTPWKEVGEEIGKECLESNEEDATVTLSDRRQRRAYEKKMKQVRERVQPAVQVVLQNLTKKSFTVLPSTTFEDFVDALKQGVSVVLEESKPEEGEEESTSVPTETDKAPLQHELERLVQEQGETTVFPLVVKHAYELLLFQAIQRSKNENKAPRDASRSPSLSRKRRRSSVDSRRSRSASLRRSRSRSGSHSPSTRDRSDRSRSRERDPRAALAVPSYRDLPPSPRRYEPSSALSRPGSAPSVSVVDEAAKAEEIIRQARLKLQAKQEAKLRGDPIAVDSEPEEGEEMEDGEIEE